MNYESKDLEILQKKRKTHHFKILNSNIATLNPMFKAEKIK